MEEKVFISREIAKVVKKHVPDDGIMLTKDLTELFTQKLVQATEYGIQMYIYQGIQINEQK